LSRVPGRARKAQLRCVGVVPQPSISVIVPTFERPALLRCCLNSLRHQQLDAAEYEVIVVDDGSGPSTAEVLEAASGGWSQLRWESLPENRGPAAARNRAIDLAVGRWLLFMDDDILAPEGLIRTHLELHQGGDLWLGILGRVQWHPDLHVTRFMRWLDTVDLQFAFESDLVEGPVERPHAHFYTCNLSLSRHSVIDVGGFNESFPYPALEDTELAVRLCRRGFRLDYRPSALAWNARPISLKTFCRRMEMVGESSVILRSVRVSQEEDAPEALIVRDPRFRKLARMLWRPLSWVLPLTSVRARYYRARTWQSQVDGILRAQERLSWPDPTELSSSG
jgi:glycosyltransferase involved in cell wall biosynthesis